MTGLWSSGRRIGRLAVPLIKEPVPFADNVDLLALPSAEGGRAEAADVTEAFDAVLGPSDLADCDLAGV